MVATKETLALEEKKDGNHRLSLRFMNLSSSIFKGSLTLVIFFLRSSGTLRARSIGDEGRIKGYLKVAASIRKKVFSWYIGTKMLASEA